MKRTVTVAIIVLVTTLSAMVHAEPEFGIATSFEQPNMIYDFPLEAENHPNTYDFAESRTKKTTTESSQPWKKLPLIGALEHIFGSTSCGWALRPGELTWKGELQGGKVVDC